MQPTLTTMVQPITTVLVQTTTTVQTSTAHQTTNTEGTIESTTDAQTTTIKDFVLNGMCYTSSLQLNMTYNDIIMIRDLAAANEAVHGPWVTTLI